MLRHTLAIHAKPRSELKFCYFINVRLVLLQLPLVLFQQNERQDLLFVLTERYRVAILGYKADTGDIVTRAYGDVQVCSI